jgi:hypothetical protein
MARTAIIFGLLLVSVSLATVAYNQGFKSPTVFIPAGFGVLIALCGVIALKDSFRKHAMHMAAMVGLLGGIGSLGMGGSMLAKLGTDKAPTPDKLGAFASTAILCLVFVALCVRSFIQARKNRTK